MAQAESQDELVAAYSAGQLSRREFMTRMAMAAGGVLGASLLASRPAFAMDETLNGEDPPTNESPGKKSTAKKSPGKKSTAKKSTTPPPDDGA